MKKTILAIAAGLLLTLPAACMHHGQRGPGGSGGQGCPKHQGCDCKCRQKSECPKPDCPSRPDCPQHRMQEPPPPAK